MYLTLYTILIIKYLFLVNNTYIFEVLMIPLTNIIEQKFLVNRKLYPPDMKLNTEPLEIKQNIYIINIL